MAGTAIRYVMYYLTGAWLGAGGAGLYFLGITIVRVLGIFTTLGLGQGVVRYISIYRSDGDDERLRGTAAGAVSVTFVLGAAVSIVVYFLSPFLSGSLFSKPGLQPVLSAVIFALPFYGAFIVAVSILQGAGMMRVRALCEDFIWPAALTAGVVALILISRAGTISFSVAYVAALFLSLPVSVYMISKKAGIRLWEKPRIFDRREIFGYSSPLMIRAFFIQVLLWTDVLMLGILRPSADVGIYFIASRFAVAANTINALLGGVAAPLLSSLSHRGEKARLEAVYELFSRWIIALETPALLLLAICGEQLLAITGKEFTGGAVVLFVLLGSQFFVASAGAAMHALIMIGNQKWALANSVAGAVMNVLLNLWLIPRYGVAGAAVATAVTRIVISVAQVMEVRVLTGLSPYSLKYVKPLAAGIGASAFIFALREMIPWLSGGPAGLAVSAAIFTPVCAAALMYALPREEVKDIIKGFGTSAVK